MGRRPLAGRDRKIIQGHRRDEFFARMRRKGGVARLPNQAPEPIDALAEDGASQAIVGEAEGSEEADVQDDATTAESENDEGTQK
jgi:hypothetical protein